MSSSKDNRDPPRSIEQYVTSSIIDYTEKHDSDIAQLYKDKLEVVRTYFFTRVRCDTNYDKGMCNVCYTVDKHSNMIRCANYMCNNEMCSNDCLPEKLAEHNCSEWVLDDGKKWYCSDECRLLHKHMNY